MLRKERQNTEGRKSARGVKHLDQKDPGRIVVVNPDIHSRRQNSVDHSDVLTADDITMPRTPGELLAWAKHKNDQLSATPETMRYTWCGAELPTKFKKEIWPLALFVANEFSKTPDAVVTPNLSNDNFDATVAFGKGHPEIFIEITQAIEGYDLALRMEAIDRDGFVSLTGPIRKVGRRGAPDRAVKATLLMEDLSDRCAKHLSFVEAAVTRKAGRQYGKNFILLVVVDDYLGFPDESCHAKLSDFVTSNLLLPDLDFMRLVIFGRSGNLKLVYELPRYAV